MTHPGLETLLITGQKRHCLWLMLWRVLKLFLKARILYNLLEARVYYHWTNMGVSTRFGYSFNLVLCNAGKATLTNCRQAFLVLDSNDGVRIRFWDR